MSAVLDLSDPDCFVGHCFADEDVFAAPLDTALVVGAAHLVVARNEGYQ